ncbi:MAG: DUF3857 domain-containing protein [Bacteroidota bacterium]|nr:DUF3857 domain-containing protein [Bacteroidota bacterium]
MKRLLIFFSILNISTSCAQNLDYRNYNYEWKEKEMAPLHVKMAFKDNDAVILQNFLAIRAESEAFSNRWSWPELNTNTVTKKTRVKIQTREGRKKFLKIHLPESLNPEFDYSEQRWEDPEELMGVEVFDYKLIYFAARILKPDGRIFPVKNKDLIITKKSRQRPHWNKKHEASFYTFEIASLDIGDELEYTYKISYPPFTFLSFNAIYFRSRFPIQESELEFNYSPSNHFIFQNNYKEGISMDSSLTEISDKEYIRKVWKGKDLKAMDYFGGQKNYLNQPNVAFYYHHNEYIPKDKKDKKDQNSNVQPYSWTDRYYFIAANRVHYRQSYENKGYLSMTKLYERITNEINDETGLLQFKAINDTLSSYQFIPQLSIDPKLPDKTFQEYIKNKSMGQFDVMYFYYEMLDRLKKPYFYCFIADNRYSAINPEQYWPLLYGDDLMCIQYKDSYVYVLPKWFQSGYKIGELPFYFENTKAVLLPQTMKDKRSEGPNQGVDIKFITTPGSTEKENYRITNSSAKILIDSSLARFTTKVTLSGQYSTLTRGFYESRSMDTTVNPLYFKDFTDIGYGTKISSPIINGKVAENFPFKVNLNAAYENSKIIQKSESDGILINLANLTKHVYLKNYRFKGRSGAFYSDFLGSDKYRYLITFDKPVSVLNEQEVVIEITNKLGTYRRSIQKIDDKTFLFESSFITTAELIDEADLAQVEEIYKAIEKSKDLKLKVKVIN